MDKTNSYTLVILFHTSLNSSCAVLIFTKRKEIYHYRFSDFYTFLEFLDICNENFEKVSESQDWFLFFIPRKFQKGLKLLFLCLREFRIPIDKSHLPSIPVLIDLFKKHRWKRLEKIYKLHKLSQVLKTKEGV